MVDVLGHLGMALIWLAPAWYFIDMRRTAAVSIVSGFWFGLLPDIDLYLSNFLPVHHHGVFHTILVVTLMAIVLGPLLGWVMKALFGDTEWFSPEAEDNAYSLGFVLVWVAGLSHIFADLLSAPGVASPLEPLWPLVGPGLITINIWDYNSPVVNWGLLLVGVVLNVVIWYAKGE